MLQRFGGFDLNFLNLTTLIQNPGSATELEGQMNKSIAFLLFTEWCLYLIKERWSLKANNMSCAGQMNRLMLLPILTLQFGLADADHNTTTTF